MMRRFVLSAMVFAAIAVQSCIDTTRIDGLESRITKLESQNYIDVAKDTDGRWYWTLNGDWLYVDNAKVPVSGADGVDGATPKMKIENGMWYVSYDNGITWAETGKATGDDTGIVSITEDGGYVCFGMSDGTVITIAKRMPLTISFDSEDVAITTGGASKAIGYSLTGASEKVVVKTLTQDGWKAKVNQTSSASGTIEITAPDPLVESEVLVFVSDGGQTALAAINCVKATIVISQEEYVVAADGGAIEVLAQTNTDFNVVIPENAKSWLSYAPTKSMVTKTFCLSAAANDNDFRRNAVVSLTDESGNVISSFAVLQDGNMTGLISIQCDTKGELHSILESYDKKNIVKMKISGVLNDVDFLDIHYEMPALRYLDISDVNIDTLPEDSFSKSTNVTTIILPKTLVTIPDYCFNESKISGELIIPASCKYISDNAFYGCSSLESVVFETGSQLKIINSYSFSKTALKSIVIPASCETIEYSAFSNCSSLESVVFESGSQLKIINSYSFSKTALKSIVIPASCKSIGAAAFRNCSSLESVVFESGSQLQCINGGYDRYYAVTIGAFSDCTSLKSIEIPASCKSIEADAFRNCSSLESVVFESGSQLETLDSKSFSSTGLKSIIIPASITSIGDACFVNCSSLTDLSFESGSKLKSIGERAFDCCRNLHRIYMQNCSELASIGDYGLSESGQIYFLQIGATTPPTLGRYVFGVVGVYSVLKVPAGSESAYKAASGWKAFSSITAID